MDIISHLLGMYTFFDKNVKKMGGHVASLVREMK
jgi:hypothetical protein